MKIVNDDNICFEFDKKLQRTMLICTVCFLAFSFCFFCCFFIEREIWILFGALFFTFFMIFSSVCYLVFARKKIILKEDIFYVSNIFKKVNKYALNDIIKANMKVNDGIILITKENTFFKIDNQMSNYDKIFDKLSENDIKIVDNNNNVIDINDMRW